MIYRIFSLIKRLDWANTVFLTLTPIIGIGGTAYLAYVGTIPWQTVVLAIVMGILTGVAITAGYHRLFSHRAFEAKPFFKMVMLFFGAAAFENSAIRWASDHRRHHKYVDTDLDPYNIKRGFFWAHMGWVMVKYADKPKDNNVPDLEADPLVLFQHNNYVKLGMAFGFLLPMLIGMLWGDPLGGFLVAGFLRIVLNHHFTFSINSFAHLIGKRPYSDQNSSRDSWFLALFTYGEGYHNYHHTFPTDYRNGIRAYHWDPTKWLVRGLEKIGQTYNLRRIPNETILRRRLRMDEKRLMLQLENQPAAANLVPHHVVVRTREKIEEAYVHFRALKMEYRRLKKRKLEEWNVQLTAVAERIEALRLELSHARLRFHEATAEWGRLCGTLGVPSQRLRYS